MKILVTGGLGFIGSHAVVELLDENYDVVVIDNLSNSSIDVIEKIKKITGKDFDFYQDDVCDLNALEKYKTSENEYDMTKASSEEVTTMIDNLKDDDEVIITKNDDIVDQNPPLEVMNGDPTVVTTVDEIEEEAMAETFKENKERKGNVDPFTYSWNGIEIDYIL